ncbi:MAG: DNA polymerase III subunit delta' [Eubacteriales bacterium]|nr:DNA polymerase III subunit delta' [Eubacteriales bacterium]
MFDVSAAQPQSFHDLIGQSTLTDRLLSGLSSGRIVHACVFTGASGTGKHTLARLYAQALLCQQPTQAGGCGQCPACRKLAQGNHPDLHWIDCAEKDSHGVDVVRALTQDISLRPYASRHVVVLEAAQLLTVQAQNALLKTMEEPPAGTVLILLAENLSALLSTILSRCAVLHTQPLESDVIARRLQQLGAEKDRAQAAAVLANGSMGKALSLLDDPDAWQAWQAGQATLEKLLHGQGAAEALDFLQSHRKNLGEVLTCWESALRQQMLCGQEQAFEALNACMAAREALYYNVTYSLLADALVFKILGGRHGTPC